MQPRFTTIALLLMMMIAGNAQAGKYQHPWDDQPNRDELRALASEEVPTAAPTSEEKSPLKEALEHPDKDKSLTFKSEGEPWSHNFRPEYRNFQK